MVKLSWDIHILVCNLLNSSIEDAKISQKRVGSNVLFRIETIIHFK